MFGRLDSDGDRRVSLDEFRSKAHMLEQWGVQVSDAETVFRQIDADGGGHILFDEFCQWAAANNLDIEDDDDYQLSDEDLNRLRNSDFRSQRN